MSSRPERLISVDPGDVHVGFALWENVGGRWRCERAKELEPERYADVVFDFVMNKKVDWVAMEGFSLGGGQEASFQRGSTFGMVELIGLTRHLCRWNGVRFDLVSRADRANALKRMKAVRWGFPRAGDHVKDAIAVGARATGWSAMNHFEGDGCRST